MDGGFEGIVLTGQMAQQRGEGNHRGIVGAKRGIGEREGDAFFVARGLEGLAQGAVQRHAARESEVFQAGFAEGAQGLLQQYIDDGFLERGAEIGQIRFEVGEFRQGVEHAGFQAGEGKVQVWLVEKSARKGKTLRVAAARALFYVRSAGVGETEHFGDFVKGLARGIVERAAELKVGGGGIDPQQQGVTAGDDQRDVRRHLRQGDEGREQMAFEVVDGEKWFAQGAGHGFCGGVADEERRSETGPGGGGEGIDLLHGDARIPQSGLHQRTQDERMIARSQLRHHATVGLVEGDLRGNFRTENARGRAMLTLHDGHCGFIAGGFNGKNERHGKDGGMPQQSIRARGIAQGEILVNVVGRSC